MGISLVMRGSLRPLAVALSFGALAACSSFGDDDKQQGDYACPRVSILGDAEHMTQFKAGDGRDLIDVMFEAEIRNIKNNCKILEGRIVSDVSFELVATRGPAGENSEGKFNYFVAVTEISGRVLAKEKFDTTIAFTANRRAGTLEITEQSIPTSGDQTSADFEILVGFQLTAAQLKFNRRQ